MIVSSAPEKYYVFMDTEVALPPGIISSLTLASPGASRPALSLKNAAGPLHPRGTRHLSWISATPGQGRGEKEEEERVVGRRPSIDR